MDLTLTIVHELPGRIRMGLSHPLRDPATMETHVLGHPGLQGLRYSPVTLSLLVRFDPGEVEREEILIRVGMAVGRDLRAAKVSVRPRSERHELAPIASLSGLVLGAALATRAISKGSLPLLDWVAAVGTAGAVADHGMREVGEQGVFDPEVLSLVYLASSMVRGGSVLAGATFTWLTTFGRHILQMPGGGIDLRLIPVTEGDAESPRYEVVVSPGRPAPGVPLFLNILWKMTSQSLTGGRAAGGASMIEAIRKISETHGQVLEGLGDMRSGIPIRLR